MWQKFSFYDFRVIAHYLGVLMMFLAAAECVPFAVAVVLGEWRPASHYLFGMGIALIVGSLLRLILPSPGKLTPKQALAVTGFAWLALALLGCIRGPRRAVRWCKISTICRSPIIRGASPCNASAVKALSLSLCRWACSGVRSIRLCIPLRAAVSTLFLTLCKRLASSCDSRWRPSSLARF